MVRPITIFAITCMSHFWMYPTFERIVMTIDFNGILDDLYGKICIHWIFFVVLAHNFKIVLKHYILPMAHVLEKCARIIPNVWEKPTLQQFLSFSLNRPIYFFRDYNIQMSDPIERQYLFVWSSYLLKSAFLAKKYILIHNSHKLSMVLRI